jgi:hypothetical protein
MLTFPLIMHMGNGLDIGDPALNTWILAWDVHALVTDPLNLFNTNIFYPVTENTLAFSDHLFADMLIAFPVIIITHNPILAYNIILFVSFIASGYAIFLLIDHYIADKYSAFIGGVIFAFCTIRFAHFGHLQLLTVQWLPLSLLYIDKFLHKDNFNNWLLLLIFYLLQVLSGWYYAFYVTLSLGIYAIYIFLANKEIRAKLFQRSFQFKSILFFVLTIAFVAPFAIHYIQAASEYGFVRGLSEVGFYSADLADYLLTTPNSILFGNIVEPIQIKRNIAEHSLFPGISALLLALYGIFTIRMAKLDCKSKLRISYKINNIQFIYLLLAVVAFILSLGTPLHIFGHILYIDMPYKYLYEYLPGFKSLRVPSRFGMIVMISLSVLAGYGANKLISTKSMKNNILLVVLFLFLIVESLYIPVNVGIMPVNKEIPEVYKWLSNETGSFAIVELPTSYKIQKGHTFWRDTEYMYYSTYHWKKLFNGYSGFLPKDYWEILGILQSFPSNKSIDLLENMKVKYVIIHTKYINKTQWYNMSEGLKNYNGIYLKKIFNGDYVYELESKIGNKVEPLDYPTGFLGDENWSHSQNRWMQDAATIMMANSSGKRRANLSLQALSL